MKGGFPWPLEEWDIKLLAPKVGIEPTKDCVHAALTVRTITTLVTSELQNLVPRMGFDPISIV